MFRQWGQHEGREGHVDPVGAGRAAPCEVISDCGLPHGAEAARQASVWSAQEIPHGVDSTDSAVKFLGVGCVTGPDARFEGVEALELPAYDLTTLARRLGVERAQQCPVRVDSAVQPDCPRYGRKCTAVFA